MQLKAICMQQITLTIKSNDNSLSRGVSVWGSLSRGVSVQGVGVSVQGAGGLCQGRRGLCPGGLHLGVSVWGVSVQGGLC